MNYAYNILITLLATRAANSLGKKKVDRLVHEATYIVVMDWCEFDYDKDAQWLELIASVEAGSDVGEDLVSAIISQMNFMGTLAHESVAALGGLQACVH